MVPIALFPSHSHSHGWTGGTYSKFKLRKCPFYRRRGEEGRGGEERGEEGSEGKERGGKERGGKERGGRERGV